MSNNSLRLSILIAILSAFIALAGEPLSTLPSLPPIPSPTQDLLSRAALRFLGARLAWLEALAQDRAGTPQQKELEGASQDFQALQGRLKAESKLPPTCQAITNLDPASKSPIWSWSCPSISAGSDHKK